MDEKRMNEAYKRFLLAYKKSAKRGKCLDIAGFANEYLCDRSTDKGKRRYLRKTLPHLSKDMREQYMDAVYCCRFCDKYFPLWYVRKAEWEETGEFFERVITSTATESGIIPGDVYQPPCVDVVYDGENNCFEYNEVNDVPKTDHIGYAKHRKS
jgi:hypothetical protein